MNPIVNGKCRMRGYTNCLECRTSEVWRISTGAPVDCPHGYNAERLPLMLGDAVERIARPIAKLLGFPCYDESGKLKPKSGCAERKAALPKIVVGVRKS